VYKFVVVFSICCSFNKYISINISIIIVMIEIMVKYGTII